MKNKQGEYLVWKTKEGVHMTMAEIGDSHLINIIRLLKRKHLDHMASGHNALCFLQGEHALDAAESDIDQESEEMLEKIEEFEIEAMRRKLTVECKEGHNGPQNL